MPPLAWGWARRVAFGLGRIAPLDWGAELWKWDVVRYEGVEAVVAERACTGKDCDDDLLLYEATSMLLRDVIDVGGGVEREFLRLNNSMIIAQSVYENLPVEFRQRSDRIELEDGVGFNDPSLEDAWYSVEGLIIWARVLDDCLGRSAVDRKKYPDQGMIPALADGPRRDAVIRARASLLAAGVSEARYLAGLHMQSIHAGSKSGRVKDGIVPLPFPGTVTSLVSHRRQLSYNQRRDRITFANKLFAPE